MGTIRKPEHRDYCSSCNTGLGMFNDSIELMQIAIKYLL